MKKKAAVHRTAQDRALRSYRKRLEESGLARFEVLGLGDDRELIRSLARRLAQNGRDAGKIRAAVWQAMAEEAGEKGGILEALRRSPLVGAELEVKRPKVAGRRIDL